MDERPSTINEIFVDAVRRFNSPCAFGYKRAGRWVEVSHAEAFRRVRAIALGLHQLGVRKSDLVLLLAENSMEWILADLGILMCGAADVPLYQNLTTAQVEYIARDSEPKVAFVSGAKQLVKLEGLRSGLSSLQRIILFEGLPDASCNMPLMTLEALESLGEGLARSQPELFDTLWQGVDSGDLATLIYTSGTTGKPKGVMLSHGNIASNVLGIFVALKVRQVEDVALTYLPFSHIFERTSIYGYIHAGSPLYLAESFYTVGDNLREVRPTLMTSVPRLFEKIYQNLIVTAASNSRTRYAVIHWSLSVGRQYAELSNQDKEVSLWLRLRYWVAYFLLFRHWHRRVGGRIRFFISGGAPLSKEIAFLFLAGRLPILQGYGLTETSPVVSVNPPDANRIGTVGKPLPNVEVRIAEDGEILVRGPGVMSGYYRRDGENRAAFDNGWFRTGDLGYLDEEGYLVITDRKKDLIKTSGGKYVAPQPIENLILASRFVNQVVVVGNQRKFPAALVAPNPDMLQSYATLKGIKVGSYMELLKHPQVINLIERQVAKHTEGLAQFEKIKRIAILEHELTVEAGELTPTLKVKRREVEHKFKALIDSLYQEDWMPGVPDSSKDAIAET